MPPIPQNEPQKSSTKALVVGLFALIAIAAVAAAWQYRSRFLPGTQMPAPVTTESGIYQDLATQNADFTAGMTARGVGDFTAAEASFRRALSAAKDSAGRSLVSFWLADTAAINGKYGEAIAMLKTLAADSTLSARARASAVQQMSIIYRRYRDPAITQAIFNDDTYAPLRVKNDIALTYRHLSEYAAHIYPLPLSELYIASWYANEIQDLSAQVQSGTTSLAIARDADLVRQLVDEADSNTPSLASAIFADPAFPALYVQRAIVATTMELAGQTGYGDGEQMYKDLLDKYASEKKLNDGSIRLQYAIYLANKYGSKRSADITALLVPLVASPTTSMSSFDERARSLATQKASELKASYALLASLDKDFKTLLSSYGWDNADFATK